MITFDGIIFSARNRSGGVAVYFRNMLRLASLRGAEMRVLVHDPALRAESLGCRPEQLAQRAPRLLEQFRTLKGIEPGILHSSYYRFAPQPDVRNVITVYDFTYEKFLSGPRAWVHTRQKRAAIRRAAAVLCISENTRRDLLEFEPACDPARVFVTHLAADEAFTPLAEPAAPIDRPYALFVAGRGGYKNFAGAVAALQRTPDLVLACVGGGAFTPQELELLERSIPGRYRHMGAPDTAGLNRLYNSAVCLLYPSLYEGFGIPPLEAMRAGCPFIALNRSSVPEVAGAAGILLDEPDPAAIAAAIERCASPAQHAALREAGFAQAQRFSWQRTFEQTLEVYEGLRG